MSAARAVAFSLGPLGALLLLYVVAVGTETGAALDRDAIIALDPDAAPRVYRATESLLDTISVISIALFGAAVAGLALLRRRPALALGALGSIAAANLTSQLLKPLLGSLDPTGGDVGRDFPAAFPSGHATVAASLAVALVLVAPAGLRRVVAAGGAAYAAAVGVGLVLIGWHYPSDVAGGYLVVALWAGLVVAALGARPSLRSAAPLEPGVRRAAAVVLAAAFAAILVVGTILAVARAPELLTAVEARTTFFLAALSLVGLAFAVLGTLAAVLERGGRPA